MHICSVQTDAILTVVIIIIATTQELKNALATLVGSLTPGRYLTFSCSVLTISVRFRPSTFSSYIHMRTFSSNMLLPLVLLPMILAMADPLYKQTATLPLNWVHTCHTHCTKSTPTQLTSRDSRVTGGQEEHRECTKCELLIQCSSAHSPRAPLRTGINFHPDCLHQHPWKHSSAESSPSSCIQNAACPLPQHSS